VGLVQDDPVDAGHILIDKVMEGVDITAFRDHRLKRNGAHVKDPPWCAALHYKWGGIVRVKPRKPALSSQAPRSIAQGSVTRNASTSVRPMKTLLQTNDAVLISFVESLLNEANIGHAVLDGHMSVMEGSLGVLPRRVLVEDEDWHRAVDIVTEAGIDIGNK